MWYTTRTEGFDTAVRKNRVPFMHEWISQKISIALRVGLGYKLLSMLGLFLSYYAFKGKMFFTYNLENTSEIMRDNPNYFLNNLIWQIISVLAVCYLGVYHFCLADDAAWARGYRAGSKIFGTAVILDALSQTMQLAAFLWLYKHYSDHWWTQNYGKGGIEWLFLGGARVISGISIQAYGVAIFLLESYHDEGTNEWHAVLNLFLYYIAGTSEIFSILFGIGGYSFIASFIAHLSGFLWSLPFEEEAAESSGLHETELVNQVEEETNRYSNMSPYMPAQ